VPSRLHLSRASSSCTFAEGSFEALAPIADTDRSTAHGHWLLGADGDLIVRWGTDFAGVELTLRPAGSGLRGAATTYRDVGDENATVDVRLDRLAIPDGQCAAEPAVAGGPGPRLRSEPGR
jgi:hypothetical protein